MTLSAFEAQILAKFPWRRQKHLLSADWQPRNPTEVARMRAVMSAIAARHPDLTHAHILGDLVDRGWLETGAPTWGFKDFLADWRARLPMVPLARAFFMPGNHDRDDTSIGAFKQAWSLQTFREWIGKEVYSVIQGNMLWVYVGDMGGSNSGSVPQYVLDAVARLCDRHRDKNVFLCLHQPISNAYLTETELSNPGAVQAGSSRWVTLLNNVAAGAANICAVFYGHVGSASQFADKTIYGTRHLQIGMHLPSNVDNGRSDQYYTMDLLHGALSVPIRRWNATTNTAMDTKTVALKYPLVLAPETDFDGRYADDGLLPSVQPRATVLPLDEFRSLSGGSWGIGAQTVYPITIGVEDRANDSVPDGFGVGIEVLFPAGVGFGDDADNSAANGYIGGLGWVMVKTGGAQEAPDVSHEFWGADGGIRKRMGAMRPNGLHIGHDGSGGNPGFTGANDGVSLNPAGYISAYRTGGIVGYYGRSNDGKLFDFYRAGVACGGISISGSSTAFNTTSDRRLKCDLKPFDGLATIGRIEVFDFEWIGGGRSRGVMAQDLDLVAPYAVTQGGADAADDPWRVDYSKLVPDLIRAVQQLRDELKALKAKME